MWESSFAPGMSFRTALPSAGRALRSSGGTNVARSHVRNSLVHGGVVRIAIAGASGFLGRALVEALVSRHDDVIGLSRQRLNLPGVEGHAVDVADEGTLRKVLTGCESGFYLAHSLGARNFRAHDRRLAEGFGRAAAAAGVQRIVYLGGLGQDPESEHLAVAKRSARHSAWEVSRSSTIPFALVVAAGVAALGIAFGAWALAASAVLASVALVDLRDSRAPRRGEGSPPELSVGRASGKANMRGLLALFVAGLLVLLVAAWPTWAQLSGSLKVAQAIASTSNSGNLHSPLRPSQLFGVWLGGSYKLLPIGGALTLTSLLIALVLVLVVVGVGNLVRSRRYALAGWFAGMVIVWLALVGFASTWANAKTLMLTSPAVMLMAWAGIAALRDSRIRIAVPLVAFLLVGGVLYSDALLYHSSNLAPTARYEELASINKRFAGRGPTLFTDFDEYSLYELRDMDVGGPDFVYPPPALALAASGYGDPVDLNRIAPAALASYPLILTRRDPTAVRPPAAYRLLWQGVYYQVWGRISGGILPGRPSPGAHIARIVNVPLVRTVRPPGWTLSRKGIVMGSAGTLSTKFILPHAGVWELWLKGDVMRALTVRIDGLELGTLGGQLDGNSLVVNVLTPLRTRLDAGSHTLTISRPGADLAPGDGGAATLAAIVLVRRGST